MQSTCASFWGHNLHLCLRHIDQHIPDKTPKRTTTMSHRAESHRDGPTPASASSLLGKRPFDFPTFSCGDQQYPHRGGVALACSYVLLLCLLLSRRTRIGLGLGGGLPVRCRALGASWSDIIMSMRCISRGCCKEIIPAPALVRHLAL